jgi:hypothetical protein
MTDGKLGEILSEGLEILKDSAKELGATVGPGALLEKALHPGGKPPENEVTKFLQNSAPERTPEELAKLAKEDEENKQKELAKARKNLTMSIPVHLRVQQQPKQELRPGEQAVADLERKKAMEAEAQKKQQAKPLATPLGKKKGVIGAPRRMATTGFEGLAKDKKIG